MSCCNYDCNCREEGYSDGLQDGEAQTLELVIPLLEYLRTLADETENEELEREIKGLIDTHDYRWLT